MTDKIGFVGVGRMGSNMARRLKERGYSISSVYDSQTAAAQALAQELGSIAAGELKEVTAAADVIVTVVTDDRAMKEIFSKGLLVRAKGKLFINCATVTPDIHWRKKPEKKARNLWKPAWLRAFRRRVKARCT